MDDNTVVIINEPVVRIRGGFDGDVVIQSHDEDANGFALSIKQLDTNSRIHMRRDEAEALFLVLDTMLHPDEE